ncbi:MAG: signal peptidase I [Candidatus Methanomarinus sp.]|uniref:Signal peptidase I n=1 Tax=Candidatus Methanomarinus sp. TaxID=3386244 RepID=A0AC61SC52_9EURY|nr:MAG: signal peptidase I [ANME-2 cluster archaeon]
MSFIEQMIGGIIYSALYLCYDHPSIVIIYFFWLFLLFILYRVCINKPNSTLTILNLQKIRTSHKTYPIGKQMKRYDELSKRPKLLSVLLPLLITGSIAYIILNSFVFFAIITSGSMSPTLEIKDLVLIQNLNSDPQQGDIIMFDIEDVKMPVIHRIYSCSNSEIRTKGDACELVDNWVLDKNRIQGEAVLINGRPIVVKNIGEYLLFDESNLKITEYGSQMYRVSQVIKSIKNLGLVIFILCVLLYIFMTFAPGGSRH